MEITLRAVFLLSLLHFSLVNGQIYNVRKYGAKGDGTTDDSKAFVEAWKAMCGSYGKSKTLLIPSGNTFLLQPVVFQGPCRSTFVTIQFDGKIVAPINKEAWSNKKSQMWVQFVKISGLIVHGSGTIDGRGSSFWEGKLSASKRPTQLHFQSCDHLTVTGITSLNSPRNHISISRCKHVKISQIKMFAPENSPNTDGIDIAQSSDVDIFDTAIGTGDDCVAINTGSVDINITRMICGPGHGISVGSLGRNGEESVVRNVQVTDSTFKRTQNGVRIKTWPNGKGYATNIVFKGIRLIETNNPIIINQQYVDRSRSLAAERSAVAISNVKFTNIYGTAKQDEIIKIDCSQVTSCKDIVLDQIAITTINGKKPVAECSNVYGKMDGRNIVSRCYMK